jgi:hypothetical protein
MFPERIIYIDDLEKGYYTIRFIRPDGYAVRHFIKL